MLVLHAHQSALDHTGAPTLDVLPYQLPDERPVAHVQLQAVLQDVGLLGVEPRPASDPEPQRQPVGDIHQVLVHDRPPGDLGPGPVIQAGDVGARVVDPVGFGLREGAPGHEVAVAQRAQRLPQPLTGGIEAVVDQGPDARWPLSEPLPELRHRPPLLKTTFRQSTQRDVVERGHDQISARPLQQLLVAEAGHPQRGHPGCFGGLDPAGGVLHHETVGRADAELLGGGQKDGRVGLALGEVAAGDVGVEQLLQRHPVADEAVVQPLLGGEAVQADPLQEQPGVLGRRRGRHPDPHVLDGQDEPQRIREGHEPALLDQLDHVLLLAGGVPLDSGVDVGHPEVLHRRPGAGHPRHPGHDLLVHRRGEPLRAVTGLVADVEPLGLHQHPERLAPGQLMRRVHQHAVYVEDRTLERHDPSPVLWSPQVPATPYVLGA